MSADEKANSMAKKLLKILIPAAAGIAIASVPPPEGLGVADPTVGQIALAGTCAVQFIGVFAAVVLWLIFNALPTWMAVITGCTLCVLLGVADPTGTLSTSKEYAIVFSSYAGSTIWTIIGVFGVAAVIGASGLLKRVALIVLSKFPENYVGQVGGILVTCLLTSPLIPSTTAKTAIITPFVRQVSSALGYKKNSKGISGMFNAAFFGSQIFGNAFFSGSLIVFIVLGFVPAEYKAMFTWTSWLQACALWLVVMFVLAYIGIVLIYNPKRDTGDNAVVFEKGFTKKQLDELGPMSKREKEAIFWLVLAFAGWCIGGNFGLDAGVWSLIVMAPMVVHGDFTVTDFVTKMSWPMVFFVGGILCLAGMISVLHIDAWIAPILAPVLAPITANPYIFVAALCILTYIVRLVIVSQVATVTIFYAALSGIGLAAGINPWVIAWVCYMSSLCFHFEFSSAQFMTTYSLTNGEMTSFKNCVPANVLFMAANLAGCLISVPVWQMMGLM